MNLTLSETELDEIVSAAVEADRAHRDVEHIHREWVKAYRERIKFALDRDVPKSTWLHAGELDRWNEQLERENTEILEQFGQARYAYRVLCDYLTGDRTADGAVRRAIRALQWMNFRGERIGVDVASERVDDVEQRRAEAAEAQVEHLNNAMKQILEDLRFIAGDDAHLLRQFVYNEVRLAGEWNHGIND